MDMDGLYRELFSNEFFAHVREAVSGGIIAANTQDCDGDTLLHWAAEMGDLDVVVYLVENGANVNVTNGNGRTPLYGACLEGHIEIVKFLLNASDDRGLAKSAREDYMQEFISHRGMRYDEVVEVVSAFSGFV